MLSWASYSRPKRAQSRSVTAIGAHQRVCFDSYRRQTRCCRGPSTAAHPSSSVCAISISGADKPPHWSVLQILSIYALSRAPAVLVLLLPQYVKLAFEAQAVMATYHPAAFGAQPLRLLASQEPLHTIISYVFEVVYHTNPEA